MGNQEQGSKSGMSRLLILLVVAVIGVGGVWGFLQYLESGIPKADPDFAKQKAPDAAEPEEEPTSLEVWSEILGGAKPSKEIEELKGMKAEEVAFTYDAIMKMSPGDLEQNIKDLAERLQAKRQSLPPSIGGATAGAPPETDDNAAPSGDANQTVAYLALPLEVMRQVAGINK